MGDLNRPFYPQWELHDQQEKGEVLDGYFDGFRDDRDVMPTNGNRSPLYHFGWRNGRDDRVRQPRDTADVIREEGRRALEEHRRA